MRGAREAATTSVLGARRRLDAGDRREAVQRAATPPLWILRAPAASGASRHRCPHRCPQTQTAPWGAGEHPRGPRKEPDGVRRRRAASRVAVRAAVSPSRRAPAPVRAGARAPARHRGGGRGRRGGLPKRPRHGADQGLHRGLDPSAGRREAGVVRGVRVGGDSGETSYLTGAVVQQGEDRAGPFLALPHRVERMHQGCESHPYTPQECFELPASGAGSAWASPASRRAAAEVQPCTARRARSIQRSVTVCVVIGRTSATARAAPSAPTPVSASRRASSPGCRTPSSP